MANVADKVQSMFSNREHPSDILNFLKQQPEEVILETLSVLPAGQSAELISHLDSIEAARILRSIEPSKAGQIFGNMNPDDAVNVVEKLSDDEANKLLEALPNEEKREIEELAKYEEDDAGGLMTPEYVSLHENLLVKDAIGTIRKLKEDTTYIYNIYVTNDKKELVGVISLKALLKSEDSKKLEEIMNTNVIAVTPELDQEEVARMFAKYDFIALPVVDEAKRIKGIITVDDIVDVIEEEATEDILKLSGTGTLKEEEIKHASIWTLVKRRLPWLVYSLIGGFLASLVIHDFEDTLQSVVIIAIFIPIIMDMGGNVGTQSSTIAVRSFALGELSKSEIKKQFFREFLLGTVLSGIFGLLSIAIILIWLNNIYLAIVVGLSLAITILLAVLIGFLVPVILHAMKIDPAYASAPFVTTIKDITGLMVYFYIVSRFLHLI